MLFEPLAEQELLKIFRQAKAEAREAYDTDVALAIDYMEGRQRSDIESVLQARYPRSQAGDSGSAIAPVTVPLVERYVAEAANAYNKPVVRKLIDADGEETEQTKKLTKILKDHLDAVSYDEHLHLNEKLTVLLKTSAVWYQAKRSKLRPVVTRIGDIHPVAHADGMNPDGSSRDPKDQDDYAGFIVQLVHYVDDSGYASKNQYAFVSPSETRFYYGSSPYEPMVETMQTIQNEFSWQGEPLQMLTFWHDTLPTSSLVCMSDMDLVYANREINIQLSMLFDTLRLQGWSVPVINRMTPNAPAQVAYGARFPVTLAAGEAMTMVTGGAPYSQIVDVLKSFSKMLAVAKRMSPNDFALDGVAPASGFAKLVDSLPKIEARAERIRRLKAIEEQIAWPRICSVLVWLGVLPEAAAKLKLRVEFADIEFPRSVTEENAQQVHEFQYGLDSPAAVLMRKHGITREEADTMIAANKGKAETPNSEEDKPQEQPAQSPLRQAMSALVAQRSTVRVKSEQPEVRR